MEKKHPRKRINIVSVKMVKDSSVLFAKRTINHPDDIAPLAKDFINGYDREVLAVCCLDTANRPTCLNIISMGSLNSSIIHPREVFKTAVLSNAASIILFHNHPSGICKPSINDIKVTENIEKAGDILGIGVLDHLIIGEKSYYSIKSEEEIYFSNELLA